MDRLRELDHIAFIRFVSVYQSFDDLEQLKQEVDALYAERTERVPGQTTLRLVDEERRPWAAARAPRAASRSGAPARCTRGLAPPATTAGRGTRS